VHSQRKKEGLKWLKRLLKRISKYESRLGYWRKMVLKQFKMNGKEVQQTYKQGHKLARN
jgi:hypothetical protein